MHIAGLSTANSIELIVAATGVVALLIAAWNAWITVVSERRRTQPLVMAHEEHGRTFSDKADYFAFGGYITNESSGHAFNIRFGVELHGVRYAQKLAPKIRTQATFSAYYGRVSAVRRKARGRS